MAKDPAFLFYPGDWLSGTIGMTLEQKGAYMELLMMQFNRGHMTEHMIGQVVGQVFGQIKNKFVQDTNGCWYNKRLEEEQNKRKSFTDSRKNNRNGNNQYSKPNGHMTSHMENENIVVIVQTFIEDGTDEKKTIMVIVEMMKTWMKYKPDYSFMKEVDYPALLKLAYFIAERKGWKKASVVGEREKDTLNSFEKICKFISTKEADAYLKRLTIDGISVPKNFQKLEEAMKRGTTALEERQKELEKKRITPEEFFKD